MRVTSARVEKLSPKAFAEAAEFAIRAAKKTMDIELRYDLKSLGRVDEIIEAMDEPEDLTRMVLILGSYVGEVFRRVYRGRWEWSEEFQDWSVALPRKGRKDGHILPFAKVKKRFVNGEADSIGFFARVIHDFLEGKI